MPGLSISDLINVQVVLSPLAVPTRNFGALLLLGSSNVINVSQRIRQYSTLDQVAIDFGTAAPEYLAADLFFSQNPQPNDLYIGRWAQSPTAGLLVGAVRTAGQQALSNFTGISDGSMVITVDSTVKTLTAMDFTGVTNLNGVATVVTTALAGAVVTWDANASQFTVTSHTTGTTSILSYATAAGSGTDVSSLLGLTQAAGAVPVNGIAAETLLNAVSILAIASNSWYGLTIAASGVQDSDTLGVAEYIEGSSPQRLYGVTSQDVTILDATSTTDIASQLKALAYNHTYVQYSSSSPYAGASLFARQATVDFTAQNSTITLMFKQEPGVAPEVLTESQAAALKAKNCNAFVQYNNSTAIIQFGTVASGQYIDTIVGTDWLRNNIQTRLYSLLYTNPTKIPQLDSGVNQLVTEVSACITDADNNGLVAPGVWNGPAFGAIKTGQTLTKGYYVYAPPIATQSQADREARKAPPITCAIKLGGAIHSAPVLISVNQ